MSAQKAAQVVARLDVPSDEGDLSQQHHEEWIFLNRNTIDMNLLREISDALLRIETDLRHLRRVRRADFHQASGRRAVGALLRGLPGSHRGAHCRRRIRGRISRKPADEAGGSAPALHPPPNENPFPAAKRNGVHRQRAGVAQVPVCAASRSSTWKRNWQPPANSCSTHCRRRRREKCCGRSWHPWPRPAASAAAPEHEEE